MILEEIMICFAVFGGLVGYIGARLFDRYVNCVKFTFGSAFTGMSLGISFFMLTGIQVWLYTVSTGPNAIARSITRPVVFYETAKQCEFFIEHNKNEYVILEDN